MNNPASPPHTPKKLAETGSVKSLLLALGVTSTLAFWSLVARDTPANAADIQAVNDSADPAAAGGAALLSRLPAMPKLVEISSQPGLPPAAQPAQLTQPAPGAPAKIFLGGASPVARVRRVVTTTRSSK